MKSILNFFFLAATASAAAIGPTPQSSTGMTAPWFHRPSNAFTPVINPRSATDAPDPVQQLLYIAPTSNTCGGASDPKECATSNPTTVKALVEGFAKYGITTAEEQAALISWMAYESNEFKYNRNHFPAPGKPGQGTRCMMSPAFVKEYANSIPELKTQAAALTDPDAILALVQTDEYSFAAASWYYNAHCTDAQKGQIKGGGQANWASAFINGCVNTAMDDSRIAYWNKANEALGIKVAP